MSRFARCLILAVAVCGFALPSSAIAADPVPTTTRVFQTYPGYPGGTTTVLTARISSDTGIPTGSVVFTLVGDPTPLGPPVPVDPTGAASMTVPRITTHTQYRAEFTGTGGYADSGGDWAMFGEWVVLKAEPTILRIGGPGLLKITMTFAVRAYYLSDGRPAVGEDILFTQKNAAKGASGHPEMDPNYVYPVDVCSAVVDVNGYATCKGSAAMSSILALLTQSYYANHLEFPIYQSVKLPPIVIG